MTRSLLRNAMLSQQRGTMVSISSNFNLSCPLTSLACQTPRSPIVAPPSLQKAPSNTTVSGIGVPRQAPSLADVRLLCHKNTSKQHHRTTPFHDNSPPCPHRSGPSGAGRRCYGQVQDREASESLRVSVHSEEQKMHHKVTKDTKARALFSPWWHLCLGVESICLAFGQEETCAEKAQRNQRNYSVALWSYLAVPVSLGRELPLNGYRCGIRKFRGNKPLSVFRTVFDLAFFGRNIYTGIHHANATRMGKYVV